MPATATDTIVYLVVALTVAMIGFGWAMMAFIRTFMSDTLATYKADAEANRLTHKENMKEMGQAHNAAIDRVCQSFDAAIEKALEGRK